MKYLTLETFTDFECIGSECPYTCCGGWQISIDEKTDSYYQSVEGEMGERLKNCIERKDGKAFFIMRDDGYCPFLRENGLCSIYIELGEEHLGETCTHYPRYMYYSGDICFAGVSISCPEAARAYLMHKEPLQIDFAENDDNKDVDPDTDWELFNRAIRTFTTAVSIAQNREFSAKERIALVVLFVNGFQACVDEGRDPSDLIGLYSNPEYYRLILEPTGINTSDLASKSAFSQGIMLLFRNMRNLDTRFPELKELIEFFKDPEKAAIDMEVLENAFSQAISKDNELWIENVLVYALFRQFMTAPNIRDFYDRIMVCIGPVLTMSICITALYAIMHGSAPSNEYIIMLIVRLSRIIEHDHIIGKEVIRYFREARYTDPGFVLKLIS